MSIKQPPAMLTTSEEAARAFETLCKYRRLQWSLEITANRYAPGTQSSMRNRRRSDEYFAAAEKWQDVLTNWFSSFTWPLSAHTPIYLFKPGDKVRLKGKGHGVRTVLAVLPFYEVTCVSPATPASPHETVAIEEARLERADDV